MDVGVQVLDFDLSASSHFLYTLNMRFGVSSQAPLLNIRGHMWLLHVCTLLGYFCNRNDCPWVTFAAPWAQQIDSWTLCNGSWMFRVLAANDDDLVQKNVVWQGWQ